MDDQPAADNESKRRVVEERAYFIWETNGKPLGCDLDHWLQAEAESESATRTAEAATLGAKTAA